MKNALITLALLPALHLYAQQPELPPEQNPSSWIKIYHDGYVGFLDRDGEEVVPPVYEEIGDFGEYRPDWALVRKDGFFGFIDSQGNIIIAPEYEEISKFGEYNENWALVQKNGLYGFIDPLGEEVVPPVYDEIEAPDNN